MTCKCCSQQSKVGSSCCDCVDCHNIDIASSAASNDGVATLQPKRKKPKTEKTTTKAKKMKKSENPIRIAANAHYDQQLKSFQDTTKYVGVDISSNAMKNNTVRAYKAGGGNWGGKKITVTPFLLMTEAALVHDHGNRINYDLGQFKSNEEKVVYLKRIEI
mmetsp:Transcript_12129/g.26481  ORF Transcript_12129/g.26481 Transcript_12129/m.26481 type:complete len:161 (-) Transcript_12129:1088-1570(-)